MGVRTLTKKDLEFAKFLTFEEGWNYTLRELEIMLQVDPDGSFVYEDEECLGFSTSVTYSKTGVLGHLIVDKKGRGRRIGDSLLKATIDHITKKGAQSIILYATQEAVKMYKRHGFEEQGEISCMHLQTDSSHRKRSSPKCVPMLESDLPQVIAMDRRQFGDDRGDLIRVLFREGSQHTFKIEREGSIVGYIMARHDHDGYDLGPWTCETGNPKDAEDLFWTELSTFDEPTIYMGSFASNIEALRITDKVHKVRSWRIPLMVKGEARYKSDISSLYGIAAFELG